MIDLALITIAQQPISGRSGWDISQQREHLRSVGFFDRPSPPSSAPMAKVLFAIRANTNFPNGSYAPSIRHSAYHWTAPKGDIHFLTWGQSLKLSEWSKKSYEGRSVEFWSNHDDFVQTIDDQKWVTA